MKKEVELELSSLLKINSLPKPPIGIILLTKDKAKALTINHPLLITPIHYHLTAPLIHTLYFLSTESLQSFYEYTVRSQPK